MIARNRNMIMICETNSCQKYGMNFSPGECSRSQ